MESPIETVQEKRSEVRVPLQMQFRMRESLSNLAYEAKSENIHRSGLQIVTEARLQPDSEIELWPDEYEIEDHFVGGRICWLKPSSCGNKTTYGVELTRPINWPIPLDTLVRNEQYLLYAQSSDTSKFVLDSVLDGVFSVDSQWRITSFNRAAELLTGWSKCDAIGRHCHEVFKANCCEDGCIMAQCISSQKPVENHSIFITHAHGNRMGVKISASPLLDRHGEVVGGVQIFRGAKSLHNRAVILDNIGDGVFTVDTQWRITSFNRAAEEITGVAREKAIGRSCSEILNSSICGKSCPIASSIATGKSQRNQCIHFINPAKEKVPVSICAAPMYDIQGNLIGGVETFRDLRPMAALQEEINRHCRQGDIISRSKAMNRFFSILPQIASSESTVLISGESGTGKELVAKSIHSMSERSSQPLVTVNCGALPDTLLESELFGYKAGAFTDAKTDRQGRIAAAEGGTLFLDEIGEVSPAMQVKLLRVLENRSYEPLGSNKSIRANIRVLAATNRDLQELISLGVFREDLYYRLNVAHVSIPPLRDRMNDIPLLCSHFVKKFNEEQGKDIGGMSDQAMEQLFHHSFPGNIRELQNIIEYAFILCPGGLIQPDHLPPPFNGGLEEKEIAADMRKPLPLAEIEKQAIFNALKRNEWKRMKTCRELGISKDTLRRKISRYKLNPRSAEQVA